MDIVCRFFYNCTDTVYEVYCKNFNDAIRLMQHLNLFQCQVEYIGFVDDYGFYQEDNNESK